MREKEQEQIAETVLEGLLICSDNLKGKILGFMISQVGKQKNDPSYALLQFSDLTLMAGKDIQSNISKEEMMENFNKKFSGIFKQFIEAYPLDYNLRLMIYILSIPGTG
jgi:hypothetical protein